MTRRDLVQLDILLSEFDKMCSPSEVEARAIFDLRAGVLLRVKNAKRARRDEPPEQEEDGV